MEKIIQIIRVFDPYKMRHIEILNSKDSDNRFTQMYKAMQEGKVKTDDDAAFLLYGNPKDKALPKYRNFKKDFKKRVLQTMVFIDSSHEDFDDYQKAVYDINREWLTVRSALRHGLNDVSTYFGEILLEDAQQYEYTDIVVQILDLLKHTSASKGDKKKFAEYQALAEHYNGQWLAEQKAKDCANLLKMDYVKKAEYNANVSAIARTYFEELKPLMEKYDSFVLHLNATIVEIYIYSSVSDYKNLLDVAERGVKYFSEKEFKVKAALSMFLGQQMIALMMLKRYDEAYAAINASLALRQKGTFNWFKGQESKVALCFRTHRYTEGYAIYKEITAMPEFKTALTGMNKEMWFVFNAYFHLLHKLGVAPDLVLDGKAFDFKEFIKAVPTFEQDKKGMHLALVILEICFMMSKKERDTLIDRIEALQKHLSRYSSKTDPSYRFYQFGNMLLEIPKSGFKRSLLEQNTAHLFKDLQSVPYDMVEAIYRSEVVELEELWVMVLNNYEKLK